MAHLLNIPENVMIQQLFPYLDHNDLLRLRRVSKQTKALADAYLWTPKAGHQGKWELKIDYSKENQTLQAFLKMGLPPPSRLHFVNVTENGPSEPRYIFKDEHLGEFMEHYSKYVTNLRLDKLFFPFTSANELGFYESLVNLKKLRCGQMTTVEGAAQFEEKTRNAEGSFLVRPTFKNLKVFKLDNTDCMDSMWNFVNGVAINLEQLLHPFKLRNKDEYSGRNLNRVRNGLVPSIVNFSPVQEIIERRGMKRQSKLVYDWKYLLAIGHTDPLELLRVFASCRDNGVMIKNLRASFLRCLLCDENGRFADIDEVVDPIAVEWICNPSVNYQRNLFVGNIIHSLVGWTGNVFLMEMPALENITTFSANRFEIYRRRGVGYPQWPNLKKLHVMLDYCSESRFLLSKVMRPMLEELSLDHGSSCDTPLVRNLGNCCTNLKRLTVYCSEDNDFFLALWNELPLLEDVTLDYCSNLTNKGFVGNSSAKRRPVFLKLEKLKHLTIRNLERMPRITNTVFKKVFCHLKLSSFKLCSDIAIRSITIAGIKELRAGPFAKSIVKLDLDQLKLQGVSEERLKQVVSRFRCSKML